VLPGIPDLNAAYDLGVIETFMRRLPPRTRGDYGNYLEQFRLRPQTPVSDMGLLAYTGAKLPSDGFSIVNPLDDMRADCELLIELAGFRHVSVIPSSDLSLGAPATLVVEPDNTFDPNAVSSLAGLPAPPQTRAARQRLQLCSALEPECANMTKRVSDTP